MATYGKKRRNFLSAFTVFHDGSERRQEGNSPLCQADKSSHQLSRPLSTHLVDRNIDERVRPASFHIPNRALPGMEHHFLTQRRRRSKSTDKPLPPKPTEHPLRGAHEPKSIFETKNSNLKMLSGNDNSKSPGKSPRKLQISEPFDPKKCISQPTNQFGIGDQSWTSMSRQDKQSTDQNGLPDTDQETTALPQNLSVDTKPGLLRSSSAFSFGSSLSFVGSVFNFGPLKRKGSSSKAKKPIFGASSPGQDYSGRQPLLNTPDIDTTLRRNPAIDDAYGTISDHQACKVIGGSPQLQKFFFGTKTHERGRPARHSVVYRTTDQGGSPTRSRRSMYDLGRVTEESSHVEDGRVMQSQLELGQRGLEFDSEEEEEDRLQCFEEPIYRFADKVKPRLIMIGPQASSPPEPVCAGLEQDASRSNTQGINTNSLPLERNKFFNENISGLYQHPNVLAFASRPAWYEAEMKEARQKQKLGIFQRLLARDKSRRDEILIPEGYSPLWINGGSASDIQVPSNNGTRASSTSKRSSTNAELTEESPTKIRKSKGEEASNDIMAGFELMTALDGIHRSQHGESEAPEASIQQATSRGRSLNRDNIDTLAVETEEMNLTEPQVPPRHPGRLLLRSSRLRMPLSMENRSETHIPVSNFSTSWSARNRRDGYRAAGEVPLTRPPHNTPNLLPSPQFPRDHKRIIGRGHGGDSEDELQTDDENYHGIGLAE